MPKMNLLTPQQAWEKLAMYRRNYYNGMSALYSGDHDALSGTGEKDSFWRRNSNKCRVHVPLASDIAATSSNLLFSQEPTYTIMHDDKEEVEGTQQKRLEDLLLKNSIANKLTEAAETCAAMGDVYMKLRWSKDIDYPIIDVVQPDNAWPEYILGELQCVHFFTEVTIDYEKDVYIRAYECYTKGNISMAIYRGNHSSLGTKMPDMRLTQLGYKSQIKAPIDDMLAVHIANIRPNRRFRSSMLGRSDFEGIRNLFDSLDETFSSWMRDIRLAKAKLIVPAEYLRTKPSRMEGELNTKGVFEFDADVETYVSLDINTDTAGGTGITPSQFDIRSDEHSRSCKEIIQYILQMAGYSPQSFGINVEGSAASGTALNIRERKSAVTKNKKLKYWQSPLEHILTVMVRVDHALNPGAGSDGVDSVSVTFADSMGADASSVAETIDLLYRAQTASRVTRIRMMHPDWDEKMVTDEEKRLKEEFEIEPVESPNMLEGDLEDDTQIDEEDEDEKDIDENDKNAEGDEGEEAKKKRKNTRKAKGGEVSE